MYTKEQQEAMAGALRGLVRYFCSTSRDPIPAPATVLIDFGILRRSNDIEDPAPFELAAPWLAPPDDSVALDHPRASDYLSLVREKTGNGFCYQYRQDLTGASFAHSPWERTEEAARVQWNKLCREAS